MPDIFIDKHTNEHNAAPEKHVHPDEHAIKSVHDLLHSAQQTLGLFSAHTIRPQGVTFGNQEPDEVIILFLRRHLVTNLPWIAASIALCLVPPILFTLSFIPGIFPTLPAGLLFSLTAFYYLIVISYAFSKYLSWFYNIGIVTQKRIVDLDSINILNHNSATAIYNEIVDVKFTQKGFFQSYFDYGDIHIQTEALHANFEFMAAPKPGVVSDIISDLRVATKGGAHARTP